MKHFIFIVIVFPILYALYSGVLFGSSFEGTHFFNIEILLQSFIPLLLLSVIVFNKKIVKLFNKHSKLSNVECVQCLEVTKGIQRLSIYLSMIYWGIYAITFLKEFVNLRELTPFASAFQITLYLCLFNFLILLPLETKLKIRLASEE